MQVEIQGVASGMIISIPASAIKQRIEEAF